MTSWNSNNNKSLFGQYNLVYDAIFCNFILLIFKNVQLINEKFIIDLLISLQYFTNFYKLPRSDAVLN